MTNPVYDGVIVRHFNGTFGGILNALEVRRLLNISLHHFGTALIIRRFDDKSSLCIGVIVYHVYRIVGGRGIFKANDGWIVGGLLSPLEVVRLLKITTHHEGGAVIVWR